MHIDICIESSIPVSERDILSVSEAWEKRLYPSEDDLDSIFSV